MTNSTLTADQALDEFRAAGALLTGHFVLSSGLHSPVFLQKMFVFQDPARTERLCRALAGKRAKRSDRSTSSPRRRSGASFRATRPRAGSAPRRSSSSARAAPSSCVAGSRSPRGARVLMVEDIITTGLSSRETLEALAEHPGTIVGAACLIDRSGGKADIGVPRVALATLDIPAYAPDALPPSLRRFRAVKPGSRALAGAA